MNTRTMGMKERLEWESNLKEGEQVIACWTNSYNYFSEPGVIVKINRASYKIKLLKGNGTYPQDHKLTIPRLTFGSFGRWSINNCVERKV